MNGRFQMQGGKNWILPKEMNANRFFWDSHWLEIWSNHFYPSMGPNGGSVAMDSGNRSFVYSVVPSPTGQREKKAMTDLEYDVSLVERICRCTRKLNC
jgi:hypothetical protein